MMEHKHIIIKLHESLNTKSFDEEGRVHHSQFSKVKELINKAIDCAKNWENTTYTRPQETISILGSRGSGKTSFLYSIKDEYEEKDAVAVIPTIDPTLIEQKGHVFLTIISQIKKLVDKKLNYSDCNPDNPKFHRRQVWEEKLRSLAHGLPTIDGIGHPKEESWEDPEYIMHKGLCSVQSAMGLESRFHEFVDESLNILGKKIFLLLLDDIDVEFSKGWPVLETLRKYITTPKIVTLLSGDINLFGKAVRKQQWKNFGKELLINEGDKLKKINEYNHLVTEMEGQYLQKVLKPERRVRLTTLWEKNQMDINIDIDILDNDKKEKIDAFYKAKLKSHGIISETQSKVYYTFLMNLPLRTQIQFLQILIADTEDKFSTTLFEPFLSDLAEKQVNIELANERPQLLNVEILQLLLREKKLSKAYQLQPTLTDTNLNASLTALSLLFSSKVKQNPFLIFDYILKIGYTSNLAEMLGHRENNKQSDEKLSPSIEGLCEHAEMFQENVLRNVAGRIIAYLTTCSDNDKQNYYCGIMHLYGFAKIAKGGLSDSEKRIDYVFQDANSLQKSIAFFPLSVSRSNKNKTAVTYSVFTLLATIGEFLKLEKEEEIKNHIQNLSQIRSYIMPDLNNKGTASREDDVNDIIEESGREDNNADNLAQWINRWKKSYSTEINIAPYLIGKITTRFFYALLAIEKNDDSLNLAQAMQKRIITFLNTVLVEEAKEKIENVSGLHLNYDNPNKSETILKTNLQKIVDSNYLECLPLSKWIFSCPLLLLYINMQLDFIKYLQFNEQIIKSSIYEKLSSVPTSGMRKPKFSGSKQNVLHTVDVLSKADMLSYSVIKRQDIEEIRKKYAHLFGNEIQLSSVEPLLKYVEEDFKRNSIVKHWIAGSVEATQNSETK